MKKKANKPAAATVAPGLRLARGIRNNNPMNIRYRKNVRWQGQIYDSMRTDREFVEFQRIEYGVRAAIRLLTTYYYKHQLHTVTDIVQRWAPAADGNDTVAYARQVRNELGSETLVPTRRTLFLVLKAMCWVESRYVLSDFVFDIAYAQCGCIDQWPPKTNL